MIALVPVAQEAVVTGGLAGFRCVGRVVQILTGVGVEVADRQRFARDFSELRRIVDEAAKDARASLSRLEEHEELSVIGSRQRLGGQLLLLKLEDGLDS